MSEPYYYHYLKGIGNVKNIAQKDKFYNYLKELFYDYNRYKWKVKKYKEFIKKNNLNYSSCGAILNVFGNTKYLNNMPGSKGYVNFVNSLQKLNKIDSSKRIKIKVEPIKFFEELYSFRNKYLKMTNEEYFSFISKNFNTSFTQKTIKAYHYKKIFY